jgi:5-methylcytosine-specific restriction endonuclease McrA
MAVPKGCLEPMCPEDAMAGKARCRLHESAREKAHQLDPARTGRRTNGAGWQRARRQALRRDGYSCRVCGQPAQTVHHVDGDAGNDDLANLLSTCWADHRELDAELRRARREQAPAGR